MSAAAKKTPPATGIQITTYPQTPNGGRRRAFEVLGVKVLVEPCRDDAHGKRVAELLARAAETIEAVASSTSASTPA
jgi:hypothetical protein